LKISRGRWDGRPRRVPRPTRKPSVARPKTFCHPAVTVIVVSQTSGASVTQAWRCLDVGFQIVVPACHSEMPEERVELSRGCLRGILSCRTEPAPNCTTDTTRANSALRNWTADEPARIRIKTQEVGHSPGHRVGESRFIPNARQATTKAAGTGAPISHRESSPRAAAPARRAPSPPPAAPTARGPRGARDSAGTPESPRRGRPQARRGDPLRGGRPRA